MSTIDTDKIIKTRLAAMELDIKQVFDLLLSINSEREFIQRILFMKEKSKKN
jgi:hypothetical protein